MKDETLDQLEFWREQTITDKKEMVDIAIQNGFKNVGHQPTDELMQEISNYFETERPIHKERIGAMLIEQLRTVIKAEEGYPNWREM